MEAARLVERATAQGAPLSVRLPPREGWGGVGRELQQGGEGLVGAVRETTLVPARLLGLGTKGRLQVRTPACSLFAGAGAGAGAGAAAGAGEAVGG